MRVIGTAGHVDHGKSALVKSLTGIDPDRLAEEQERQMTIDLGFAWMTLPSGEEIGIVDVPGHRDFIENMLAGIGGIDAALLVIASDEGVMPQTREHLAILDLLHIERAIVALSKADLIEDEDWFELVESDVRALLKTTHLADAPILAVSSKTGAGLEALVATIDDQLKALPERIDRDRPRLPIDRVFSITGFGTVVTGTLSDGRFEVGDEVEIAPQGQKARIRGLETHKQTLKVVVPGSRVAVNLSGVNKNALKRGDVLIRPASYQSTGLLDVHFRLLAEVEQPIKHDQRAKLFIGASQRMARIRLLGQDKIIPGEQGWLQLVLDEAVMAERGDFFILRRPSPPETLGGGRIADPNPTGLHKRKDRSVLERLQRYLHGTPEELISENLMSVGFSTPDSIRQKTGLELEEFTDALETLLGREQILLITLGPGPQFVIHQKVLDRMSRETLGYLDTYHRANPLRFGMPKEELGNKTGLPGNQLTLLLQQLDHLDRVEVRNNAVRAADFEVRLTPDEEKKMQGLLASFQSQPYSPPTYKECIGDVGEALVAFLLESGALTSVSPDILFATTSYEEMVRQIEGYIKKNGTISVAEVRDLFQTSRKYALPLMEHLDSIGLTIRDGDVRKLKRSR